MSEASLKKNRVSRAIPTYPGPDTLRFPEILSHCFDAVNFAEMQNYC